MASASGPSVQPMPWPSWVRWLIGAVVVVPPLAAASYGTFMWWFVFSITPYTDRNPNTCSSDAWFAAEDDAKGARYLLLDDLLVRELLKGRSRSELEALLGPLILPRAILAASGATTSGLSRAFCQSTTSGSRSSSTNPIAWSPLV